MCDNGSNSALLPRPAQCKTPGVFFTPPPKKKDLMWEEMFEEFVPERFWMTLNCITVFDLRSYRPLSGSTRACFTVYRQRQAELDLVLRDSLWFFFFLICISVGATGGVGFVSLMLLPGLQLFLGFILYEPEMKVMCWRFFGSGDHCTPDWHQGEDNIEMRSLRLSAGVWG